MSASGPDSGTPASRPKTSLWRRLIAQPQDQEQLTSAQRRYDSIATVPMFLAAMLWLVSAFFSWVPELQPMYRREGNILGGVTWLIFAADLTIRFVLDPRKKYFLARSWPLFIALAFPPLRIILVISAVIRMKRDRNSIAKMVGLYALYAVLFVVTFGALFTLIFEIDAPGANIVSFGDAVWWGFVTVTTVGYGDFHPITSPGRVVAVVIMFTGAASVGAVTAAVASRFINSPNSAATSAPTAAGPVSDADAQSPTPQQPQQPQQPRQPQQHRRSHPSPAIGVPRAVQQEDTTLETLVAQVKQLQVQISDMADRMDSTHATRGNRGE
jgi:voltage-gated potassium channel